MTFTANEPVSRPLLFAWNFVRTFQTLPRPRFGIRAACDKEPDFEVLHRWFKLKPESYVIIDNRVYLKDNYTIGTRRTDQTYAPTVRIL